VLRNTKYDKFQTKKLIGKLKKKKSLQWYKKLLLNQKKEMFVETLKKVCLKYKNFQLESDTK